MHENVMRSAVVSLNGGQVLSVIVANALKDEAPKGCLLVDVPDGACVDHRYVWTRKGFEPNAALKAEQEVERQKAAEDDAAGRTFPGIEPKVKR
jgi:hypothetical protein